MTGEQHLYIDLKVLILGIGCFILKLKEEDFEKKYGYPLWIVIHMIVFLAWGGFVVGFGHLFPKFLVFKIW